MSSETVSSAASGAATGAKVGSVIPGVGTVVGAVIGGVVGGLFGSKSSKRKKRARRAMAQLNKLQTYLNKRNASQEYLETRAQTTSNLYASGAGTEKSSGYFGILGSLDSQRGTAIRQQNFVDTQSAIYERNMRKAADTMALFGAINAVAGTAGDVYEVLNTPKIDFPTTIDSQMEDTRGLDFTVGGVRRIG